MRVPATLALVALIAASCAPKAPPETAPVTTRIAERAGVPPPGLVKAGGEPAMPAGVALQDGLTAEEAVALALLNSPRFRASLAALNIAEADIAEAGVLRNPVFSLLLPWGPKQLEWTLRAPIEAIWVRPKRVAAAQTAYRAVAERLVQDGLALVRDVEIAHADAVAADARTRASAEAAQLAREIATITASRLRAGDISELEGAQTMSEADIAEQHAIRARYDVSATRARLGSLVGLDAATAAPVATPSSAAAAGCASVEKLMKDALALRPDLRAAEIDVEAAAARAGAAKAQALAVSALLDANAEGKEGFELGPGFDVEVPVFGTSGRARASAELERAGRVYLATRQQVLEDVRRQFAQVSASAEIAAMWRTRIVPALEREAQQARRALAAGDVSRLSVLLVERRLSQATLAQQDADAESRRSIAALEFSVGKRCAAR